MQIQPKPRSVVAAGKGGSGVVEAVRDGSQCKDGVSGAAGNGNRYQAFVKRWYADVKKANPAWGMGEVMAELARRYRVEKEAAAAGVPTAAGGASLDGARAKTNVPGGDEGRKDVQERELEKKLVEEVVLLESESEEEQDGDVVVDAEPGPALDGVARKLDFLSLRQDR